MSEPVRLPPNCEYCGIAMRYDEENFVCTNGHPPHRVFEDGRDCACLKCGEKTAS
jgi:hypothetical protein